MQLSLVEMAIHIRDATARDLPRIIEIERLAFPAPWTLASFERELTLPFSRIMLAIPPTIARLVHLGCSTGPLPSTPRGDRYRAT